MALSLKSSALLARLGNSPKRRALVVLGVLLALTLVATAGRAEIAGTAVVLDGDTLKIDNQTVALHGIAAPALDQPCRLEGRSWSCGQSAAMTLVRLIDGRTVTCFERDRNPDGRLLAVCYAGGRELNTEMVRLGLALARTTVTPAYVDVQDEAKRYLRGLWRGTFIEPWVWRPGQASLGPAAN